MSSGSATGNPRNKVSLKPGHSLMDWIRVGNSGKDLAGTGGSYLSVTNSQLAQHNKSTDAWLSIRGKVYNVTSYMEFHPGGVNELLKGVGTDATKLFNEVHGWVNYESILQKCVVGQMKSSAEDEDDITSSSTSLSPPKSKNQRNNNMKVQNGPLQMDWFQQVGTICLVYFSKTTCPDVLVQLEDSNLLCIKINTQVDRLRLENAVSWPCNVMVDQAGKVQVRLTKKTPGLWSQYGSLESVTGSLPEYWQVSVVNCTPITHNTYQIDLEYTDSVFIYVPAGHHVLLKACVNEEEVVRPYTPVPSLVGHNIPPAGCVRLLVKAYTSGTLSPWLVGQPTGTKLHFSLPMGSFKLLPIGVATHLVLLAAGTGITPMVSLVSWALRYSKLKVQLLFFNQSEVDIIWREQWEKLVSDYPGFSVDHVLSAPSALWTGETGHVSSTLLQSYLPTVTPDVPNVHYVCVCGPTSFTQLTERCLKEDLGFTNSNYYCFVGQ